MAMACATVRRGGEKAFGRAFQKAFGRPPPKPGTCVAAGGMDVVAAALDQHFASMEAPPAELAARLEAALATTATVADQSDAWARLALAGPKAKETLERLSMVDLSDAAFGVGGAARTLFGHCDVVLVRERPGPRDALRYTILTPRSSAESLLHELVSSPPFA